MATSREESDEVVQKQGIGEEVEDDEHDSRDIVLQRYFLQEWKLVKSLLEDIVSRGGVTDFSSVYKIRSIVCTISSCFRHLVLSLKTLSD